uniref:Uncharacterized protein n=1 Tax=viral metagenome TaxID=1070528 RepID=A0A6C0EYY5_9ZZZZ
MASLETIPYEVFSEGRIVIYYFIGRLNPPHAGHEVALTRLLELARGDRSIPLILLGSGPKGERTLDNPLTFATKQRVLKHRLAGHICEIRESNNFAREIMDWTKEVLRHVSATEVVFNLVAGDKLDEGEPEKDRNSVKLNWVNESLVKGAKAMGLVASCNTIPIHAVSVEGVPMSATRVRKDALIGLMRGDDSFLQKYSEYYGPHTLNVFGEISETATHMSKEEIETYAATGKMLKKAKAKSKSKKANAANSNSSSNENKPKAKTEKAKTEKAKTEKAKPKPKANNSK